MCRKVPALYHEVLDYSMKCAVEVPDGCLLGRWPVLPRAELPEVFGGLGHDVREQLHDNATDGRLADREVHEDDRVIDVSRPEMPCLWGRFLWGRHPRSFRRQHPFLAREIARILRERRDQVARVYLHYLYTRRKRREKIQVKPDQAFVGEHLSTAPPAVAVSSCWPSAPRAVWRPRESPDRCR